MKSSDELLLRMKLEMLSVPQGQCLVASRTLYGRVVAGSLALIASCVGMGLLTQGIAKFIFLGLQLVTTLLMCRAISRKVELEELAEARFGEEVQRLVAESPSARKLKDYVEELKRPMVFGDLLRMRRIAEVEGFKPTRSS